MENSQQPPPPLFSLTKDQLAQQANAMEQQVRAFELEAARRIGFDLGQAAVIRQIARELAEHEKAHPGVI